MFLLISTSNVVYSFMNERENGKIPGLIVLNVVRCSKSTVLATPGFVEVRIVFYSAFVHF